MANPDRLTGLDTSFLHLERDSAHMHVGSVLVFEGDAPGYDEFLAHVEGRLHLVPRYRQRLAFVGEKIQVVTQSGTVNGMLDGIDDTFQLVLLDGQGRPLQVAASEVWPIEGA